MCLGTQRFELHNYTHTSKFGKCWVAFQHVSDAKPEHFFHAGVTTRHILARGNSLAASFFTSRDGTPLRTNGSLRPYSLPLRKQMPRSWTSVFNCFLDHWFSSISFSSMLSISATELCRVPDGMVPHGLCPHPLSTCRKESKNPSTF